MFSLIREFFIELYWKFRRSKWRYENRKHAMGEKPWWTEVELFFEELYWRLYPIPGQIRVSLIRLGYRFVYLPGHIRAHVIRLGWRMYALMSLKSLAVSTYWFGYSVLTKSIGFGRRMGHVLGSILRNTPIVGYWALKSAMDRWQLRFIRVYWFFRSKLGALYVIGVKIYWFIRRRLGGLRIRLIQAGFFAKGLFFWAKGYCVRGFWTFYSSNFFRFFRKVYWFIEFQIKKRILFRRTDRS